MQIASSLDSHLLLTLEVYKVVALQISPNFLTVERVSGFVRLTEAAPKKKNLRLCFADCPVGYVGSPITVKVL